MTETRILLLGPDGQDATVALPGDRPLASLRDVIAPSVGLAGGDELVLRRDDGSIIDLRASLAAARVRPGSLVLVELAQTARRAWGKRRVVPPDIVQQSGYRVLPCYLVIDTSGSMNGAPIQAVNYELPQLQRSMLREPELAEICQLSLVTFDVAAAVDAPLTDVSAMTFSHLQARGNRTDYSRPFGLLRHAISRDLYELFQKGRKPYRPVVFFLSDGKHNVPGDWRPAFSALTSRVSFFAAPNVIAFGFGDALEDNIRDIGLKAAYLPADGSASAKLDTFMKFLLSSLALSMTNAAEDEDDPLVIPPDAPTGWRAVRIER